MDPVSRRVWRDGTEIRLSRKEFDLLHALIRRPGEIVTRDQLMLEVWQTTFWTSAKTIDVHLGWLRRKLGDDTRHPTLITTIRGRGLRFELPGEATAASPEDAAHSDAHSDAQADARADGQSGPVTPPPTGSVPLPQAPRAEVTAAVPPRLSTAT